MSDLASLERDTHSEQTAPQEHTPASSNDTAAAHSAAANDPLEPYRALVRSRETVQAKVIKWQKNGLEMQLVADGTPAFMPNDNIDRDPNRNIANYFGKTLSVKVTNVRPKSPAGAEVTVSHRAFLEEELRNAGREAIKRFQLDDIVEGTVKGFSKDDVLIDLGTGIEATIRLRDLTWARVDHPYEVVKRGETLKAKVLGIDAGRRRIQLGVRQLTPDPEIERYGAWSPDQVTTGKVIATNAYGAELELSNGLVAFLPISEIAWERIGAVTDVIAVGDSVEVKLLKVDRRERRVTASRKMLIENPMRLIEATYRPGTDHNGTIKEVNRGGVVVALAHNAEGFIPRRELSHDRIERLEDVFKAGKELEGLRVIEFDGRSREGRSARITMSLIAAEVEAQHHAMKDFRATSQASRYSLGDALAQLKEQLQREEGGSNAA